MPRRAAGKKTTLLAALVALLLVLAACNPGSHAPSAFAPSGEPDYAVDFAHPIDDWCELWSEPWGEYYCQDGEYHLVNHAVNASGQRITPMGGGDYHDFLAEAAMRSVSESGSYGVIFRGTNEALYLFQVRPTGQYRLIFGSTAREVMLVPWTRSAALRQGGAVNLLQVRAEGSQITLYANGKQLASVESNARLDGAIGVVAAEDGHAAARSLKIWRLP